MPGSSEKGKLAISQWFGALPNVTSVLDVGPGWGTYSKLLRSDGQTWDCVEIHQPYVERFGLAKLYDTVFDADIRTFVPTRHYDVAICGDVLEHVSNDDAIRVLDRLLRSSSHLVVSLPIDAETGAALGTCDVYWGNPHEMHQGLWCNREFIKAVCELGGEILAMEKYEELAIYLISSRQSDSIPEMITAPREWLLRRYSKKYSSEHDERTASQRLGASIREASRAIAHHGRSLIPARIRRRVKTILKRDR